MSTTLNRLNILLGITGGIAAYKSAELCRLLIKAGANVQVVMSEAACEFITPLTLETLSGKPVPVKMFHRTSGPLEHIDLPTEADVMLVAPATADYLARCATGRASDLISSVTLAFNKQVVVAPAMNTNMYQNPATQRNIALLKKEHGWKFIEPDSGDLACGVVGKGRMAAPSAICEQLQSLFVQDLQGQKIVVTAGPTVEDIDPVRYISNRSSGKTGYAIAQAAQRRGANVILISGPVTLCAPSGVTVHPVRSAEQMFQEVLLHCETADTVIMCAAVADFRPADYADNKLKKDSLQTIKLVKNTDILSTLGQKFQHKSKPKLIGFALETTNLEHHAKAKLAAKGAFAIVSNLAQDALEGDQTKVTIVQANGETIRTDYIDKHELADIVLNLTIP